MSIATPAMTADASPFAHAPFDDVLPAAFSPWRGRLVIDPAVSETSPVVAGTYVTTRHVASLVVDGWSWAEIRSAHPGLADDDIRACLAYAIEEEAPDFD